MSTDDAPAAPGNRPLSATVRDALSQHGHGFHYAVVRKLEDIYARGGRWKVDGNEFPVEVAGKPLHIDIVLRCKWAVAVIECKRSNPAMAMWCFARSRYPSYPLTGSKASGTVAIEELLKASVTRANVRRQADTKTDHQYNVAQEIKTDAKGEAQGTGRGALTDALNQALRSSSGMIRLVQSTVDLIGDYDTMSVVPVIVTTAKLVVCDTDLSDAELSSGQLPAGVSVAERPWIWFRTMASADVRHGFPYYRNPEKFTSFAALQDADYARSIGIATWDGLEEFLQVAAHHVT